MSLAGMVDRVALSGQLSGWVKKVCLVLDNMAVRELNVSQDLKLGTLSIAIEKYGKDDSSPAGRCRG